MCVIFALVIYSILLEVLKPFDKNPTTAVGVLEHLQIAIYNLSFILAIFFANLLYKLLIRLTKVEPAKKEKPESFKLLKDVK
jgi:hypothetical protein